MKLVVINRQDVDTGRPQVLLAATNLTHRSTYMYELYMHENTGWMVAVTEEAAREDWGVFVPPRRVR